MPKATYFYIGDNMTTTGYRLTDGRYFIITDEDNKVMTIQQPLLGCGIYPAPVKEVPKKEWPEVLAIVSFSRL